MKLELFDIYICSYLMFVCLMVVNATFNTISVL